MTERNDAVIFTASDLADGLNFNLGLLSMQTAGLSHRDSLLQPQPRGNCLNWIVGHLALHREYMLQVLGLEPEVGEETLARYERESEPIVGDSDRVIRLDRLLAILGRQQERIAARLATASTEELSQPSSKNSQRTVGGHVHFLYWHETYHIGTTELLRQLAGTNDKVV